VAETRRVYFNGDIFSQGQLFKALIITPNDNRQFELRISREDDDEFKKFYFNLIDYLTPNTCLLGLKLDTSEEFQIGSYVAQIYSNAQEEDDRDSVVREHWFQVLNPDEYYEHWLKLFGETWDEPVFWDSVGPRQVEKLLEGLPLDKLFEVLPEEIRLDVNTLYDLIGPITTALVANEIDGGLPCLVEHRLNGQPSRIPHIDLTKLFWLLNAIAPVLADKMFFSKHASLEIGASEEQFSVLIKIEGRTKDEHLPGTSSPLIALIEKITEGIKFDVSDNKFRLIMEADRSYESVI
jgi:hypothetical protein